MADIPDSSWSEVDGSNNQSPPNGWPEGMFPSDVNNSARANMGGIKRWYDWSTPLVTGGTSTAYTLTYPVAPASLYDGMPHMVQFNAVNGANPSLNVNGLGAKPLVFYCGGVWSSGLTNTMPPFLLGINQIVPVVYNAASGTYRCINLPLILRQIGLLGVGFIDFTNIPTNVNNLQLMAQVAVATDGNSLLLRTYNPAGVLSVGATDYTNTNIVWTGAVSNVAGVNTNCIGLGSAMSNAAPVMVDAIAASIQSGTSVQFNYGAQYSALAAGPLVGLRGVGVRLANASISGLRLLPGSSTLNGTATLTMS